MSRRLLDERIERADVRDLDFHGRRITNASPSVNANDYVVRRELEALIPSSGHIQSVVRDGGGNPSALIFTVDQKEPGFLYIQNLSGNTAVHDVNFTTFSMDMSDISFYASATLDTDAGPSDYRDDFETVAVTIVGTSYRGKTFQAGDFIFCVNTSAPSLARIAQIKSILGPGSWSIQYRGAGDTTTQGYFGSSRIAANRIYVCDVDQFKVPHRTVDSVVSYSRDFSLLLPSKCVAIVVARGVNGSGQGVQTVYNICIENATSGIPGLFVDNGGFYTMPLNGTLALKQTLPQWISIRQYAGARCAYTKVKKPPVGASLIIDLLFISYPTSSSNNTRKVAIHSEMTVAVNEFMSYAFNNLPQNRRVPYYGSFPFHELAVVGAYNDIFDSSGTVIAALPLVPTGEKIFYAADGDLTPMVAQIGSTTPGSDATIEFLT